MNKDEIEEKLIKRIANSDRKAFSILYMRYINDLYDYIFLFTKSKEITEDILQNIFIKIWIKRTSLNSVTYFKGYLYRAAKNLLLDEIRRNQLKTRIYLELQDDISEESSEIADARLIYTQYQQVANDAINLLPKKRKEIFELRTKEDLTLDEIAEKLSISKNVVKKQLYSGVRFVKAYIEKHADLAPFAVFVSLL